MIRPLLLFLALLTALPTLAQRRELSASVGRWDSGQLGDAVSLGASYNYYWTSLLSARVGGMVAKEEEVTAGTVYVSGELHLFRTARVSPWVGVGGAFAYTRLASSSEHFTGSETAWTGIYSGGLDFAVSPRLAIGADVSYMNYEAGLGSRFGYTVDPVTISLAARWRY